MATTARKGIAARRVPLEIQVHPVSPVLKETKVHAGLRESLG